MNIFNKVALQGLRKNRTRTLVTILGVALSAALITAVTTFAVSLQTYMINGAIMKYGDWHVGFMDVDSSFVQEQAKDSPVFNTATFEILATQRSTAAKILTNHIYLSPDFIREPLMLCPSASFQVDCRRTAAKSLSRRMFRQTPA